MKPCASIFIKLFTIQCLFVLCFSQDFDFFYFVQQWPGAYCDTSHSCCYPKSGKPAADFGIHGLWPNYKDGSYPSNCNPDSAFDKSQISDLVSRMQKDWPTLSCPTNDGMKFWSHEWVKHGTCAESEELDQHEYFEAALKLKQKANLLQILTNAGIKPDDEFYDLDSIVEAIQEGTGFTPGIECNVDHSRDSQLYQIYMCVDTSASEFIECPLLPRGRCASRVQFPKF
ncbi:Ribonuclease 3 [Turnera subulata]|uniref:Ribonuclease 3 n=1 Tax=Turnera subulata TaxID=218843 RepID=A0A9Q0GAW3_9ROSI|nr:Ribonuclease 3 [Turnera subulata]